MMRVMPELTLARFQSAQVGGSLAGEGGNFVELQRGLRTTAIGRLVQLAIKRRTGLQHTLPGGLQLGGGGAMETALRATNRLSKIRLNNRRRGGLRCK